MLRNRFLALTVLALAFAACESDYSFHGEADTLVFSADTLTFDTVFTSQATATTYVTLRNKSSKDMTIETIRLVGGESSAFNISVSGENATQVSDVRLPGKDSLYIFVNVDIPETDDGAPFCITDAIEAQSGGHTWTMTLMAYGQNVIRISEGKIADSEWTADKPYLLSGEVVVDSAKTLTVMSGTKIFLNEGASISVYGTADFQGTREEPIRIQGARLESFYDDIPGQWESLTFQSSSTGNTLENVEIAGAYYAVIADSASQVSMKNCILRDASKGAILAYGADVEVVNSLLYNCGGALVAAYGGSTSIVHCTLSNYFSWETRQASTVSLYTADEYPQLEDFTLVNSIVVGNLTDEFSLEGELDATTLVQNSLIRLSTDSQESLADYIENTQFESDANFADRKNFDYHLTEESAAIDSALIEAAQLVPEDFDGNDRLADGLPDIGAYEFIETENQD